MPSVNVLIKPASSACNMNCTYCFYRDEASKRERSFEGMLSLEAMERVIVSAMDYADRICSFTFQGGEPTLAGLDFFRGVMELEKKHRKPGVEIRNAIQTNGYALGEEWARFFAENHFLVGLSLDGPADLHNLNRRDHEGKGTFNKVLQTAKLFDRYQVEYNVLCVLTGKNARSIERIYHFYQKQGFGWLQFIPCLDPLGEERGNTGYHLSVREYEEFLVRIFDLWFENFKKGRYVSIRHLDNWLSMLLGERPEACNMAGRCSVQFVVEGDGGVYPCDFYVLDEWRMGTVGEKSFAELQEGAVARKFVRESLEIPGPCKTCRFYGLCRNGCRRDRLSRAEDQSGLNYYCAAYHGFFTRRGQQLEEAARMVLQMRCRGEGRRQ